MTDHASRRLHDSQPDTALHQRPRVAISGIIVQAEQGRSLKPRAGTMGVRPMPRLRYNLQYVTIVRSQIHE